MLGTELGCLREKHIFLTVDPSLQVLLLAFKTTILISVSQLMIFSSSAHVCLYAFFAFCLLAFLFKIGFHCVALAPETHKIDQTGLDLCEIDLPLPPKSWD